VSRVPSVLCCPEIQPTSPFFDAGNPPWSIKPIISSVSGALVPLISSHQKVFRLALWATCQKEAPKFCVVASDAERVRFIHNCSLPRSTPFRGTVYSALTKALDVILSQRLSFNSFEIFLPSQCAPAFLYPNTAISSAEANLFKKILSVGNSCHLILSADALSPGFQLAKIWATLSEAIPHPLPYVTCLDRASIVNCISDSLYSHWNEEWISSTKGSATRLFIPTVCSASALLNLRPSVSVYQLISGHCALNGHQNRFGFSETAACLCGHAVESIDHFLFECPRFDQVRLTTLAVAFESMPNSVGWPFPLYYFPQHVPLWNALVSFVHKTKRLNLNPVH
jgi:hypothetical protein